VAIFHAAAVGDFEISTVYRREPDGTLARLQSGKYSTRDGILLAELRPTPKILAQLRDLYPRAWITGWKYEVDGTQAEVLTRARHQLQSCRSDAVVANGPAYGPGFCWLTHSAEEHLDNSTALNQWISDRLRH
jgi:phosphopantothenoylcysteine decarboxylase/phosphopantothenate--cysteine ligase